MRRRDSVVRERRRSPAFPVLDLAGVDFALQVEASLGGRADAFVDYAEDICHVHAALREPLHAEVTVTDGAFP